MKKSIDLRLCVLAVVQARSQTRAHPGSARVAQHIARVAHVPGKKNIFFFNQTYSSLRGDTVLILGC